MEQDYQLPESQETTISPNIHPQALYRKDSEKARTDKLLAKDDIKAIEEIIRKDRLELKDLRNLVYLLAGAEIKLVNLGKEDRVLMGKFLTWIRDLIAIYEVRIKNNAIILQNPNTTYETILASKTISQLLDEYIKYLAALYLYGTRSSLSLGATAFSSLNTEKFEYEYNTRATNVNQELSQKKKFLGVF
ncbi:MAG TPA: hypothetical protein PKN54_02295 [Candidatus Cloacimonas acidaminovorans]|nr:hypothetical protein [Candidatus Cloacimonas acidaminovorans]